MFLILFIAEMGENKQSASPGSEQPAQEQLYSIAPPLAAT